MLINFANIMNLNESNLQLDFAVAILSSVRSPPTLLFSSVQFFGGQEVNPGAQAKAWV